MKIEKQNLFAVAKKVGISKDQADNLWSELEIQYPQQTFNLPRVLYYFGALLVLVAMSWFLGETWGKFGGQGIFWISLLYIFVFVILGTLLWNKKDLQIPGGIFITLAVCLIPLAVYGLQTWAGWWIVDQPGQYRDFYSWIRGGWFLMEVATLIGGCFALYFCRFPFLTMPVFFSLWFMSMDIAPLIFGETDQIDHIRKIISIVFGLGILIVAYFIDLKSKKDLAFWPYFFGVLTFWGGLSLLDTSSEYTRFLYLLINLAMIMFSVLLQRVVFLIFGVMGVLIYLSSIFDKYFADSLSFPIFLSIIGVAVIFLGIFYHKNHLQIESAVRDRLPSTFQKWLP